MNKMRICVILLFGLFYFSEGKPCPEKTRPHKTLCNTYYKCQDLPSNAHVWIPTKCDEGLIYERNLQLCVLPEDDWECNLGDTNVVDIKSQNQALREKTNIDLKNLADDIEAKDAEIEIVSGEKQDAINFNNDVDSIQLVMDTELSSEEENDNNNYEGSGDGAEIIELNGFLQAEKKDTNDHLNEIEENKNPKKEQVEKETEEIMLPTTTSHIDPKLTAHLQRLSQLIDGLKQTYQNQDIKQMEMRPDQLNAFLAHFDIKNKFNTLITSNTENYKQTPLSSTTPMPKVVAALAETPVQKNETNIPNNMKPETKVVLTSGYNKRFGDNGYSNSQIVVNHPEGSVLFSLPPYSQEQHFVERPSEYSSQNSPKISEETLKTVLELSKQMIAQQNVPKVIPNPAYYPQPTILQPLFLPAASFPASHNSPFAHYFNGQNNNPDYDDKDNRYSYVRPNAHSHSYTRKKQRPGTSNSYNKPGTTIIHNNVIPVHVSSTNSGEKEVVDSYGQSLGLYPPLNINDRYDDNKFIASVTTVRPSIDSTTPANQYSGQYPSPYSTEISVTTIRPFDYRPSASTVAEYYTPSPHLNENNVNSLYQPSERYPTIQFNNLPQPIDPNRISVTAQYPQVERPNQYQQQQSQPQQQNYAPININSLFPSRIDPNKVKIRPNSQKIESMEMGSEETLNYDESISSYSSNNNNNNNDEYLSPTQYVDPTAILTIGNTQQKHPYLPRPSSSLGSSITISTSGNSPKFPTYGGSSSSAHTSTAEGTQLVNVGGNFIRYDVFQNSVLPLLGHSPTAGDDLAANIEVITCATGVRQPNTTDCTRYYVCSKKDGKVLSYSCPPYTAFNGQTRICDAHTYSICSPAAIVSSYTISENKRIQLEAFQALQDAKRRREQALKAQNMANLLQQYAGNINTQTSAESSGSQEKDMLNSYMQQAAALASTVTSTSSNAAKPAKKRKYYCKEGDKIPDQTSINSYFVCYKNAQGMMKGHKMTCSKNLLFCPKTTMCTLPAKCT